MRCDAVTIEFNGSTRISEGRRQIAVATLHNGGAALLLMSLIALFVRVQPALPDAERTTEKPRTLDARAPAGT